MKKLKQNGIGGIVSLVIYMIMGASVGGKLAMSLDLSGFDFAKAVTLWIAFILFFYIAMVLQVIIHEGGHLVFGLLSGYKFLSFRIFGYIFVKQDEKIVLKRYTIPGTAGQCLLYPCEYNGGDFPYFMYNLGGGLMNIVFSTYIVLIAENMATKGWLWLFLIFLGYYGYAIAFLNLIPMRLNGLSNDGKNIMAIRKDPGTKRAFWCELYINAMITGGAKYNDLEDWVYDTTGLNPEDALSTYIYAVNSNRHLERGEYDRSLEIIDTLLLSPAVSASPTGIGLSIEKAFLMILKGENKENIDEIITPKVSKYMKSAQIIPQVKRLEYAYELYVNKNIHECGKKEAEFEKALSVSPNIGDNLLEKTLFSAVKEKYFVEFSENDV